MIIRHVNEQQLRDALADANDIYRGNVEFKNLEKISNSRGGGETWRVTLKVKSSRGAGAARAYSGRRTAAACWHVHGEFGDLLPETAVIQSSLKGTTSRHPGESWPDMLVGSPYMGYKSLSELCECDGEEE